MKQSSNPLETLKLWTNSTMTTKTNKVIIGRILRVALATSFSLATLLFYLQIDETLHLDASRSLRIEKDIVSAMAQQSKVEASLPKQAKTSIASTIMPVYETSTLLISYYEVRVRYPARAFDRLNNKPQQNNNSNNPLLVAGVLSMADNQYKRDVIRSTWAFDRSNVFFVLSGEWSAQLQEEAHRYQDILWLDDDEKYRRITWKTLVWFRVVRKWIGEARFVLKTDDDAYVNLAALENRVHAPPLSLSSTSSFSPPVNYLGYCMRGQSPAIRQMLEEQYPPYASGAGYILSHDFLSCLDTLTDRWLAVADEDANTGILARECSVPCQHDPEHFFPWRTETGGFYVDINQGDDKEEPSSSSRGWIHHYVKAPEEMAYIHAKVCDSQEADEVSCAMGSDQTMPKELPLYCNYQLVESCGDCVEDDERERDPFEVCSGSCYICPFAVDEPTRCIPKTQRCIPPKDFVPPPPPPGWGENEDDDTVSPPPPPKGRTDDRRDKNGDIMARR